MRAILALLLGLATIAIAEDTDDSGEAFSWDSADSGTTTSYNGLVVQAYNPDDGNPVVTLGTSLDNHEATYCFTLIRVFEATGYDLTASTVSGDETEVDGSSVDLSDANCTISETSDTTFNIACNDVNDGTLTLAFTFVTNSDGEEGLEYTITVNDYVFTQDDAQLVLEQSVKDCSDLYAYSGDSESVSDDTESDEDSVDDASSTETPDTRRLLSDDESTEEPESMDDTEESTDDTDESDSADEESGISSDDPDEYDTGYIQFIVNGQAYDDCDGVQTAIDSGILYDADNSVVQIAFAHFDCNLILDPYIGIDESKLSDDSGACGVYVMIAAFIGLIVALF